MWGGIKVKDKVGDHMSLVIEANLCHQLLCDLNPPALSGTQPDEDVGRLKCVVDTEYLILVVLEPGVWVQLELRVSF